MAHRAEQQMKRYLFFLGVLGVLASTAEAVEFRSGQISVLYDEHFHQSLRWFGDQGRNIVAFDPAAQESIEVNGWECGNFSIVSEGVSTRRIEDPEFGLALEGNVIGVFRDEKKQVEVERHVRVLLPERFPDVVIFQKSYRNLGTRPVHLGRVDSQRILLDRKLAEPEQPSYLFASFQGGAYHWGDDYSLIWLRPGFRQLNFQGVADRTGPGGTGGGMPFVDVWAPSMGVALVHLERIPQAVYLPVEVREDGRVETGIWEKPLSMLKQQEWLIPGATYRTVTTAVIFHHGDYYDALHNYGWLLRARGIAIPSTSPPSAYKPYWKTWGFERDFTQEKIFAVLPELKSIGVDTANLDVGWFDHQGDWRPNPSPGKFPMGDRDMKEFVRRVHAAGFKTSIYWYPLGVDKDSALAKEHPELLVRDENGTPPADSDGVYQLCPAYEPARLLIASLLKRFIVDWGFDGVYVDSSGMDAVPFCFNPAHHHASPLDSFQSLPEVFKLIHDELYSLKPDPYLEVCICATPHSPYNMPYYPIANASDPINLAQVRRRVKLEKAIRGPTFDVGDCYQVPLNEWKGYSVPESFETAMGVGAQLTTMYAHLTDDQRVKWTRWFHLYNELGLSSGEYLNLYDIAFDRPEVHVVRKGKDLFYGIFADLWPKNKPIELRGLSKDLNYEVDDYAHGQALGKISGSKPFVEVAFKESLLLRVSPL
jgi:alpha-galactosidase